jgi:hypothetical protein
MTKFNTNIRKQVSIVVDKELQEGIETYLKDKPDIAFAALCRTALASYIFEKNKKSAKNRQDFQEISLD